MANRVCEKCIHYDVCLLHEDNFIDDVAKNGFCGKFRNKADVVEVVRCEKCKYGDVRTFSVTRDGEEQIACYCNIKKKVTELDSYCPSGERK